jgi:hypothetical protein
MSSEATPGEWKAQAAEGRDTDWWDIVVPHFEYPGGKTLAAYVENEADARVMAAAPELRDALRALVERDDAGLYRDYGSRVCGYCGDYLDGGGEVFHEPECPIAVGRKVLSELGDDR